MGCVDWSLERHGPPALQSRRPKRRAGGARWTVGMGRTGRSARQFRVGRAPAARSVVADEQSIAFGNDCASWRRPGLSGDGLHEDQSSFAATRTLPRLLEGSFGRAVRLQRLLVVDGGRGLTRPGNQLDPAQQRTLGGILETVIPHLVSSAGQNVLQESPQELHRRQRHRFGLLLTAVPIAEHHLPSSSWRRNAAGCGKRSVWQSRFASRLS